MELIVCKDAQAASKRAGELVLEVIKNNPKANLGLATGSTPEGMYNFLIEDARNNGTSYANISTYNLDEYVGLEGTHPQSYRHFMNVNLFDAIDINKENTHVPNGMGDANANANAYDQLLNASGGIDLQILGIGANGHIAFNEPGIPFEKTTHVVALVPETIEANARFFDSIDQVPKTAVSMGITSILKAHKIVLIALGAGKADAVKAMFEDEISPNIPATALRNHPNVTVITDEAAAAKLA
ncbi:MAG: glucosamine-6-phosphate deaminase [Culicoidibacterales bacterium]